MLILDGYAFSLIPYAHCESLSGGGVYAFCRRLVGGPVDILYIGMTGDYPERFPGHHKRLAALAVGMNEIAFYPMPHSTEAQRRSLEGHLIRIFRPVLNEQHNGLVPNRMTREHLPPAQRNCWNAMLTAGDRWRDLL